MNWEVSNRIVLHNLEDLRKSLKPGDSSYKLLLNCKTGEMRFEKRISEWTLSGRVYTNPREWKEVRMLVKGVHFEMDLPEMDQTARQNARETLDFLNQRAREVKAVEKIFRQMPHVREGKRELIADHQGWMGHLGRIDAERCLRSKPVGTYLLREGDLLDQQIAFNFQMENGMRVAPYLLTVVSTEQKIVDYLLLDTSRGWTVYQDDPDLSAAQYKPLNEWIQSLGKYPLC